MIHPTVMNYSPEIPLKTPVLLGSEIHVTKQLLQIEHTHFPI